MVRTNRSLTSALSLALPGLNIETKKRVNVGFLAPLSGKLKSWAEPGYFGCLLWQERINSAGGLRLGGRRYLINVVPYDSQFQPERAFDGAKKLVLEDECKFLIMVGGDDLSRPLRDFINQERVLVSTALPSDLTPDSRTLISPSEVHPIYNVTGVDWLHRKYPEVKSAVMCTQNDAHGLPSIATYRAAFEVAGIELLDEHLFPIETTDFREIIANLLAKKPDLLCWDTAYEPFVHAMTIEAYKQGFNGHLLSCTCDNYRELVARTSVAFMEGFVFQFPDFDDPRLNDPEINFPNPNEFYADFCKRYPGAWSAVSWQYASVLDIWKAAVEYAQTFDSITVMAAMKIGRRSKNVFGDARWWGRELFGIDNALVGNWPVVTIQNGRARIVEYGSILTWWAAHKEVLIRHMRTMRLMWDQRDPDSVRNAAFTASK